MRSDRGFTLLEVLVAFTVIAMALGAAYAAMGSGGRAAARAEVALDDLARAEALMASVGTVLPLAPGLQRVGENEGGPATVTIRRRSGGAGGIALWSVEVETEGGTRLSTLRMGGPL